MGGCQPNQIRFGPWLNLQEKLSNASEASEFDVRVTRQVRKELAGN